MLSPEILALALAHDAVYAEFAWRLSDTPRAMYAIAEAGCAILGAEAWIVRPEYIITLPTLRTGEDAAVGWVTRGRQRGEAWTTFVKGTAAESIAAFESLNVADEVVPEMVPNLYFNISFVAEDEYNARHGPP